MATRDGELQPDGAGAFAIRVHEDRVHVSVFVYEEAAPRLLQNLERHPEIAVVLDLPTEHRACQLKGYFLSSRRARAAERAEVERQRDAFLRDLEAIGIPRAMTTGWKHWPCVVLQVRVTQKFEQTPGPGAGEPLR